MLEAFLHKPESFASVSSPIALSRSHAVDLHFFQDTQCKKSNSKSTLRVECREVPTDRRMEGENLSRISTCTTLSLSPLLGPLFLSLTKSYLAVALSPLQLHRSHALTSRRLLGALGQIFGHDPTMAFAAPIVVAVALRVLLPLPALLAR